MTRAELLNYEARRHTPEKRAVIKAASDSISERELQNQIAQYLNLHDLVYYNPRFGKKTDAPIGFPDFVFVYHGKPIALECKVGANQPTDEQLACSNRMTANGWLYVVARSIEDVKRVLDLVEVGNV